MHVHAQCCIYKLVATCFSNCFLAQRIHSSHRPPRCMLACPFPRPAYGHAWPRQPWLSMDSQPLSTSSGLRDAHSDRCMRPVQALHFEKQPLDFAVAVAHGYSSIRGALPEGADAGLNPGAGALLLQPSSAATQPAQGRYRHENGMQNMPCRAWRAYLWSGNQRRA